MTARRGEEKLSSEKKKRDITQSAFDQLLTWLDPERERAGDRYEEIRAGLVKIFVCQGCTGAEDLADETINRVILKLPEIVGSYVGNPAPYFSAVARFVLLEHKRKYSELPLTIDPPKSIAEENEDIERDYDCLHQCLERLTPTNRELILQYYQEEKQAKIDKRKRLAGRFGLTVNALRVRVDRIRASLEQCVTDCLEPIRM